MVDGDTLVHYSRRVMFDAAYPAGSKLASLAVRVMVVTGAHDHIASDSVTQKAISAITPVAAFANVTGAGHYIADLQYPYLRWLLESFLQHRVVPLSIARARTLAPVQGASVESATVPAAVT
jgi:hypothetical protein